LFAYDMDADSPSFIWYAFVNQVFLIMGEFGGTSLNRSEEGFAHPEKEYILAENVLVYAFFLASIFIGQIVVFNMLIAIMSNTFSTHSDHLDENGKFQKLKLVSEYAQLVQRLETLCCCRCARN